MFSESPSMHPPAPSPFFPTQEHAVIIGKARSPSKGVKPLFTQLKFLFSSIGNSSNQKIPQKSRSFTRIAKLKPTLKKTHEIKESLIKKGESSESQGESAASKVNELSRYRIIGQGKAKVVSVDSDTPIPTHVYYTAVKGPLHGLFDRIINRKEAEIKEEVQTAKRIQARLEERGVNANSSHLALDLEELKGEERIQGAYTVKTEKARRDLEKQVKDKPMSFPASAILGLQVAKGIANLHKAGYVHGDIKLENVLVYKKDGKKTVKISDFGKTKQLASGKSAMHTGNARFAAPEGRLSQQGEVFSTALMLIRTLEGELLKEENDMMLKTPTHTDDATEAKARQGVEKFLVLNKDCPQTETARLKGKFQVYGRQLKLATRLPSNENLSQAEKEIHAYIDALKEGLAKKYPEKGEQIEQLSALLKHMTRSDPKARPTMEKVVESYEQILKA